MTTEDLVCNWLALAAGLQHVMVLTAARPRNLFVTAAILHKTGSLQSGQQLHAQQLAHCTIGVNTTWQYICMCPSSKAGLGSHSTTQSCLFTSSSDVAKVTPMCKGAAGADGCCAYAFVCVDICARKRKKRALRRFKRGSVLDSAKCLGWASGVASLNWGNHIKWAHKSEHWACWICSAPASSCKLRTYV